MNLILGTFLISIFIIISLSSAIPFLKKYPAILNKGKFYYNEIKANKSRPENSKNKKISNFIVLAISLALAYKFIYVSFYGLYNLATAQESSGGIISVIYSYAWFAYIYMGVFWALEIKLGKFLPITGTIAGVLSVASITLLIFPVFYILPQIILAYIFSSYHYSLKQKVLTRHSS